MSIKEVPFTDVVWFQEGPGVRNTQYTDRGVKLLNVANLVDGKVDLSTSNRYISEVEAYGKYSHFLVDEGDFIIASSGIQVSYFDKKMGFIDATQLPLCMNTSTIRFKVLDPKVLNIRYFMYYLKSQAFKGELSRQITGSAQLNFGPSHLKKMSLPLCDLAEQDTTCKKLDSIMSIIEMRQQQLSELDNLVKARFIELFGDRYINDRKWESKPLHECADFYSGKAHEQVVDENGEYILVTSRCIASDITDYRRTNALLFPLQVNDIAMVMSDVPNGRALAKCILIDEDRKYTLNQRICCLRNYSFNPVFFYHLLNRHEYFLSFNDGNAQTNLRKDDLLACSIIMPPIELQEQFATFVRQTDKSKLAVQQSIDQMETLKASLMQLYFG